MGVQSIKISVLRNALIITSGPIPLISPTDIPTRIGFLSVFKIKLSFDLFFCILFIFTPYSKGAYTKITIVWRIKPAYQSLHSFCPTISWFFEKMLVFFLTKIILLFWFWKFINQSKMMMQRSEERRVGKECRSWWSV